MTATAWRDLWRIGRLTTVQRDPRGFRLLAGCTLLLALFVPVCGLVALVRDHVLPVGLLLRMLCGIGGFWLAFVWIGMVVPGTVLMNSAANARLLPRQRRRLLQIGIGGWLLVTLAVTAAVGTWRAMPLVGMYVLGFALMRAGNLHAVGLTVVAGLWPRAAHDLPASVVQALAGGAGPLVAMAVLLGGVAWAMARMYPAGGDRHLDTRGEQVRRMSRLDARDWTEERDQSVLVRPALRVYAASLRRDSGAPRPGRMLMHALGAPSHWSGWLGTIVFLLLVSVFMHVLLVVRGDAFMRGFLQGFAWSGLAGLAFMVAFSTAKLRQQLDRTRGEQALLRLTPLAGDRAALNARLAAALLKTALLQLAALVAVILLFVPVIGGGADVLLRQFALCCLGAQMALATLFGDYARAPKTSLARGLLLSLLAVVELAVAAALGWLSGDVSTWTWTWLVALSCAAGAFQLRRGWKLLLAAPVAFPAGRLG